VQSTPQQPVTAPQTTPQQPITQPPVLTFPDAAAPIAEPSTVEINDFTQQYQEVLPPEILLERAREEFDAGNTAEAISFLDRFMVYYPGGSDEAFWLYGQFY